MDFASVGWNSESICQLIFCRCFQKIVCFCWERYHQVFLPVFSESNLTMKNMADFQVETSEKKSKKWRKRRHKPGTEVGATCRVPWTREGEGETQMASKWEKCHAKIARLVYIVFHHYISWTQVGVLFCLLARWLGPTWSLSCRQCVMASFVAGEVWIFGRQKWGRAAHSEIWGPLHNLHGDRFPTCLQGLFWRFWLGWHVWVWRSLIYKSIQKSVLVPWQLVDLRNVKRLKRAWNAHQKCLGCGILQYMIMYIYRTWIW